MWRLAVLSLCVLTATEPQFNGMGNGVNEPAVDNNTSQLKLVTESNDAVPFDRRVSCAPDNSGSSMCYLRKCIWDSTTNLPHSTPRCYFPKKTGYVLNKLTNEKTTLIKSPGSPPNPFGSDISPIAFKQSTIGGSTLNIRIDAPDRFEPKLDIPKGAHDTGEKLEVEMLHEEGIFSFKVVRKSTKKVIWDTSVGGLLFSDQYIQIAALLGSSHIYGIGENAHNRLIHTLQQYTTWAMFTKDEETVKITTTGTDGENRYGVYPFYLAVESDGKTHGVLFLNSNAQEITLGPAPILIYRTIGGILDMYFFPGPTPEDVVRQYLALVGKPTLPAYWSLGYQLGRQGYANVDEVRSVVANMSDAHIPMEVAFAEMDYMSKDKDFTMAEGWGDYPAYVMELHNMSMRTILMIDPAVQANGEPFGRALKANVDFVEWVNESAVQRAVQDLYGQANNTKVMLGVLRPNAHVAYPDFSTSNTKTWWTDELSKFHSKIEYDGLELAHNAPASWQTNEFSPRYPQAPAKNLPALMCPKSGNKYDNPPYETASVILVDYAFRKVRLASKSLCMSGVTKEGVIYDVKDLYGLRQSSATKAGVEQITAKRATLVTRSSFVSGGRYAGHSTGDNRASWNHLGASVIAIQEFNMFGIPYTGADICGYDLDTSEQLCGRWHQLGAFYTMARNRNKAGMTAQEPIEWKSVADAARSSLMLRYSLLPYVYTLMFLASRDGGTVIRPTFFEFPRDEAAQQTPFQFMWGPSVLITPALEKDNKKVYVYFPRESTWYSLRTKSLAQKMSKGFQFINVDLEEATPVFIRGGHIVPTQGFGMTTAESRKKPFELIIALENVTANGKFIWDDGESIITDFANHLYLGVTFEFAIQGLISTLTISLEKSLPDAIVEIPKIDGVKIFGYDLIPRRETLVSSSGLMGKPETWEYSKGMRYFQMKYHGEGSIFNFTQSNVTITWLNNRPPTSTSPSTTTVTGANKPGPVTTTTAPVTTTTVEQPVTTTTAEQPVTTTTVKQPVTTTTAEQPVTTTTVEQRVPEVTTTSIPATTTSASNTLHSAHQFAPIILLYSLYTFW